jgi:hypothetical protein
MFWGPLTQAERRTPITAGRIFFTKNSFMLLLYYSGSMKYKNRASLNSNSKFRQKTGKLTTNNTKKHELALR